MNHNEVHAAFEILLEEIEMVTNALNEQGAATFKAGDYDAARRAIEEATRLAEFREKVKALQKEWAAMGTKAPVRKKTVKRTAKQRLPRGLRTPEDAFRRPILETLVELGGSAPVSEVLDRVEQRMKDVLNRYDREPLPSDPRSVRWRNTAQWCRNMLAREGLMKSDSPRSIWEISESGRKALEDESQES